jgi:radical SAM protein with 4Fe4S-binding SPASM domain
MAKKLEIQQLPLWEKLGKQQTPLSIEFELTARCYLNCRHCYINQPARDNLSKSKELTLDEIALIADQAADLGSMWCLLTGGEPLLRSDFTEIYMVLKKKGFLINVFTNACLIDNHHIQLFQHYPPRDIEVSVYGVTQETYESVTRVPGSFKAFKRGLDLLLSNGIGVTLKAMVLRSNLHEMEAIAKFCRDRSKLPFRFDPFLHLRYDRNPFRNEEIKQERLSSEEIVALEMHDEKRFQAMKNNCDNLIFPKSITYENFISTEEMNKSEEHKAFKKLFRCGIGNGGFSISYDGKLRLCSSSLAPVTSFDLRAGSLQEGLNTLRNRIRTMDTNSTLILKTCKSCEIVNLCMWCPEIAYLETGDLEGSVPYFCEVAHARAQAIKRSKES